MWLILVAPLWPYMLWFSAIPPLLDGLPWELAHQRDLLYQANGALFHPFPEGVQAGGLAPERDRLLALGLLEPGDDPACPGSIHEGCLFIPLAGVYHLVCVSPGGPLFGLGSGDPAVLAVPA